VKGVSFPEVEQNSAFEVVSMSFPLLITPMRRAICTTVAVFFAASVACAQSVSSPDQSGSSGYSSSLAGLSASGLQLSEFSLPGGADFGSPSSDGAAAGQYGQGGGGGHHGMFHSLAFEAGGGFNAPVGNDTPYISWGGNFTLGAGFHFSKALSALLEYQFMDNKLPGAFISAESSTGATAGDAHINSITGSPVIDLFPRKTNGIYLVGGFGYYHKSTNFNDYECCDIYGYDVEVTVASVTSNQWGGNAGLGLYHRLGGNMYGNDSDNHSQVFAEARYTFIHTPPVTQTNGLGTTELIPVTVGIRF
jgi:Outer membrane protein beta-barrel domain